MSTVREIAPFFAVDDVTKSETKALRAKFPEPPIPFSIRDPKMCVELTLP